MDIQIDSREKARAIQKIIKTLDDNGVKHFSSKLLVGDYMSLDNYINNLIYKLSEINMKADKRRIEEKLLKDKK